ncbi:MFS transporter, FHS family, L-fucose permease [Pedobacter westerhofensis]|uniref:MFS transporter, FHS family, L-fucose permease n=1 Tax=Pedobacter westerhofensis TaxID=425512 RepID=A0A521DI69_9SPHI|nr:sugar MFS transporter [Pedobacter westerhofensis]SMO70620.1 MFS transporter, FHS family, L-fucose permease [Pedobacter westerhofensis]
MEISTPVKKTSSIIPLITMTLLFFMWGFITCMNDILIPHLKEMFRLTFLQSMLVQFAFFGAYFIGSLIYFMISYYKGDPINKVGYKKGIISGVILSAVGCCLFYPAASLEVYGVFLAALFVLGLGFTILQITANAYVTLLGPEESASSRLNLTQAFNSFGTTIAPVLGGHLIYTLFLVDGKVTADSTRIPYLIFAGILIALAIIISQVKLPSFSSEESEERGLGALKFPQLKMGIFGIFCYVGAEVGIGSLLISFMAQEDIMNLPEVVSKNYLALYWGGAMIGRFLGAISLSSLAQGKKLIYMILAAAAVYGVVFSIVDLTFAQTSFFIIFIILNIIAFVIGKSAPARTLVLFAGVNIALLLLSVFSKGSMALYPILGIGLFNSIMFSNIYTLAISGLGKYVSQGSSLLVMAILGGALVPLIQGGLADAIGIQNSFFLPAACYGYILFFGLYCMKRIQVSVDKPVRVNH